MIIRIRLSEKRLKELDEYYQQEHGMSFKKRIEQLINNEKNKARIIIEDRKRIVIELNQRGNHDNETSFIESSQE